MTTEEFKIWLISQIPKARLTGLGEIHGGDWQPKQNECHENADQCCALFPEFSPVRGWLYFDSARLFVFHSVVRKPDGLLSDITPSNASVRYPFIEADLTDIDYFILEQLSESGRIQF
jgi:hypothetical protein